MEQKMPDDNSFGGDTVPSADMEQLSAVIRHLVSNYKQLDELQKLTTLNLIMQVAFTGRLDRVVVPPMVTKSKGRRR
jgi:hypothetical protein